MNALSLLRERTQLITPAAAVSSAPTITNGDWLNDLVVFARANASDDKNWISEMLFPASPTTSIPAVCSSTRRIPWRTTEWSSVLKTPFFRY